jgi:hypothetical protein
MEIWILLELQVMSMLLLGLRIMEAKVLPNAR